jgi:hypothetical protein
MGFVLGPGGSAFDAELWPARQAATAGIDPMDPSLGAIALLHLNEIRELARVLDVDARLAQQQNDAPRLVQDIQAMLGMSRQTTGGFLVEGLVGVGIASLAAQRIELVLDTSPGLLSSSDLTDLAHLLSGPNVTADLVKLDTERMFFADVMQRTYTDDGAGDGRLTPAGMRFLVAQSTPRGETALEPTMLFSDELQNSVGPAAMLVIGSRRGMQATYDQYMDALEAQHHRPAREADWRVADDLVAQWRSSAVTQARCLPLVIMAPSLNRLSTTAERYLGRRDGVLIGIALELHRRQHGSYPQSLVELTPKLLPQVPVDRITGDPLYYVLVVGRPVVYSVGADRDDDGGRVPVDPRAVPPMHGERRDPHPMPWGAAEWSPAAYVFDGDWVIYGEGQPMPATRPAWPSQKGS